MDDLRSSLRTPPWPRPKGLTVVAPARTAAGPGGPIVKPLPPELFTVFGSNAEMRWSAMREQGYLVPIDRFFVRNHTSTPIIDADTWGLSVTGAGLHGGPAEFTLAEPPGAACRRSVRCRWPRSRGVMWCGRG
jgi:hypothetical protein